jgi:hypothetical protein
MLHKTRIMKKNIEIIKPLAEPIPAAPKAKDTDDQAAEPD